MDRTSTDAEYAPLDCITPSFGFISLPISASICCFVWLCDPLGSRAVRTVLQRLSLCNRWFLPQDHSLPMSQESTLRVVLFAFLLVVVQFKTAPLVEGLSVFRYDDFEQACDSPMTTGLLHLLSASDICAPFRSVAPSSMPC